MSESSLWVVGVSVAFFLASVILWWRGSVQLEKASLLVNQGATLIDVDTPEDFAAAHHPGAKNIPLEELDQRTAELGPLEHPVVICGRGLRRLRATLALRARGYRLVLNVGDSDW